MIPILILKSLILRVGNILEVILHVPAGSEVLTPEYLTNNTFWEKSLILENGACLFTTSFSEPSALSLHDLLGVGWNCPGERPSLSTMGPPLLSFLINPAQVPAEHTCRCTLSPPWVVVVTASPSAAAVTSHNCVPLRKCSLRAWMWHCWWWHFRSSHLENWCLNHTVQHIPTQAHTHAAAVNQRHLRSVYIIASSTSLTKWLLQRRCLVGSVGAERLWESASFLCGPAFCSNIRNCFLPVAYSAQMWSTAFCS